MYGVPIGSSGLAEQRRHRDGEAGVDDPPAEVGDERRDAGHLVHDHDARAASRRGTPVRVAPSNVKLGLGEAVELRGIPGD